MKALFGGNQHDKFSVKYEGSRRHDNKEWRTERTKEGKLKRSEIKPMKNQIAHSLICAIWQEGRRKQQINIKWTCIIELSSAIKGRENNTVLIVNW